MDLLQAVTLGVVQGISEFLPISSTAHLILIPRLFHWEDPGLTFDVALHLGTFLAVAWYFWDDVKRMALAWLRSLRHWDLREDPEQRLAWYVLIGCVPAGLAGVLLQHKIETTFRSPYIIAGTLIGVAALLALVEIVGKRQRSLKQLSFVDMLLVGVAQAFALLPGTSRSGATMTMAMGMGLTREAAARYSFLLGVPIIFGSVAFKGKDVFKTFATSHPGEHGAHLLRAFGGHLVHSAHAMPFAVGTIASTVVGYFSIRFLMSFLQNRSTWVFIHYRWVLGVIIVLLLLTGHMPKAMDLS